MRLCILFLLQRSAHGRMRCQRLYHWTTLTGREKTRKTWCHTHLFFVEGKVSWRCCDVFRWSCFMLIFKKFWIFVRNLPSLIGLGTICSLNLKKLAAICPVICKVIPPGLQLSERLPRRYGHNSHDVFALVKHHICDTELSQPPLLVLPGDEKNKMRQFLRTMARHDGILSRQEDLLEFSTALDHYPQFARASHYYKTLAGAEYRRRLPVQPLRFLEIGGIREQGLVCAQLPPRAPRAKPHPLQVRFHRNSWSD